MQRVQWALLLAAGLLGATAGLRADEAYNIKVRNSAKGDRTQETSQDTEQAHRQILGADGKAIEDEEEKKATVVQFQQTILEQPEAKKRPTRLRRHYDKAQATKDGETKALPYEGKTVLIEKKDGQYHFKIEGGAELTGKDAELLAKEFDKEKDDKQDLEKILLPQKPVRVNETWKIDAEEFARALSKDTEGRFEVDADKARATGQLLRAYQKNGHQYGVIEYRIDLPLKGTIGKEKLPLGPGAKMALRIKMDGCIDGQVSDATADTSTNLDLTATLKGPDGNSYKLILAVKATQKGTQKDLPKE
jgi:hypothetical protein